MQKPEFYESPELLQEQQEIIQEYIDIVSEIKTDTFRKSFRLDILDFDESPEIGSIINVSIDIEFKVGNEKYLVQRERSILFSEPLPKPPHNSPGWYAGDQHVHSEFGSTSFLWWPIETPDPLDDMVDAATASELDWVMFTDHSPAFEEASEWENGRDACAGNSTGSFKCLYGQEMSIGNTGVIDVLQNGHYLAFPYSDDDLGWIDGDCGFPLGTNCRAEQPVMNEINNAGGWVLLLTLISLKK